MAPGFSPVTCITAVAMGAIHYRAGLPELAVEFMAHASTAVAKESFTSCLRLVFGDYLRPSLSSVQPSAVADGSTHVFEGVSLMTSEPASAAPVTEPPDLESAPAASLTPDAGHSGDAPTTEELYSGATVARRRLRHQWVRFRPWA